jgi:hypothetical protein
MLCVFTFATADRHAQLTHLELVGQVAVLALVADVALIGAGVVSGACGLRAAHEALRGIAHRHLYAENETMTA